MRTVLFPGGELPYAERVREQLDSGTAELERTTRPALVGSGGKSPPRRARQRAPRPHPGPRPAELHQVEEKVPQLQQQTHNSHKRGLPMNLVNYKRGDNK